MRVILAFATWAALTATATAVVTKTTVHDTSATGLDGLIKANDVIAGLIPSELPGDLGWHPANNDPLDRLPAFTDGGGIRGTNLTGLLNDFTPAGAAAKIVEYDLPGFVHVGQIRILTGNNLNSDGRVFSTVAIYTSKNDGGSFDLLGYFESDPLGTINTPAVNAWKSTLVTISDNANVILAPDVSNMQFHFYGVDNTGGQYRDPFDGVNTFTGIDDGLSAPNTSPLVWEIDVIGIPEPASALLMLGGILGLVSMRRRT